MIVGGLVALLALACWWEARSGKPAWGAHLNGSAARRSQASTTRGAATAAKVGMAAALAEAVAIDAGGDG